MKYSEEFLKEIVDKSISISQVLINIGLKPSGGNYYHITKKIKDYNIDITHFLGQGWSKNKISPRKYTKEEFILKILTINSNYRSHLLKLKLYDYGLKFKYCEKCGQGEIWCDEILGLELHHINGINNDNRIENLKILCPNCHSQTSSFCGKNINGGIRKEKKKYNYLDVNKCSCGKIITNKSKLCVDCYSIKQRKIDRPTHSQLIIDINDLGYVGSGKKYGVSDNTIRKWSKL